MTLREKKIRRDIRAYIKVLFALTFDYEYAFSLSLREHRYQSRQFIPLIEALL